MLMKKLLLSLTAMAAFGFNATADIIQNGGFESWTDSKPDHWTTASSAGNATLVQSEDAHGGSYSVQVNGKSSNVRLGYEETNVEAGTYIVTFYAKALGGEAVTSQYGPQVRPGYATFNADGSINSNGYKYGAYASLPVGEWTLVTDTLKIDAAQQVCFVVMNAKNSGDILIDDYSIAFTASTDVNPGGGTDPQPTDTTTTTIVDAPEITIAQFIANADPETVYRLTGVVANIKNTTYGNFDLVDETGSIYIYGMLNAAGETKKFASMGIEAGDTLTLQGKYYLYNETVEISNAQYVSHKKAGSTPSVDPDPLTPDQPIDGSYFMNGDFESWHDGTPDHWKSSSTASSASLVQETDAHSGTFSVLIEGATANKRLAYKELVLVAGTYTFSLYAKGEDGNETAEVRLGYAPWKADGTLGSYVYGDYVKAPSEGGWVAASYVFTLTETTKLNMVVMNPKNTGNLLVDDAKLVEGEATSIRNVAEKKQTVDFSTAVVYNLLGQRVSSFQHGGIYIVNGKKMIYK